MNWTLTTLAAASAIGLSIMAGRASDGVKAPMPPKVDFSATPASQLYLGMTAQEVSRILGEPLRETVVVAEGTSVRRLEFSGAIPAKVILTDGEVSHVTLDAFQVDKGDVPAFGRKAWPGMSESVVRRVLGAPTSILHQTLFGINVDQWVFSRDNEPTISIFFREDRVVAKTIGRDVPSDLFRINLPSPPQAESERPIPTPRVGMTASEVAAFYGAEEFRIDYVFNGQSASRVVFETRGKDAFASFTFVDGVVTEFEDLGRLPDDASFQGR